MDISDLNKLKDLDKINELVSSNDFEGAKIALEKILQDEPNNIDALKLLVLCNVNLGHFSQGKINFEKKGTEKLIGLLIRTSFL